MKAENFNDLVGKKAMIVRHNFESKNTYTYNGVVTSIGETTNDVAVVNMEFDFDEERKIDYTMVAKSIDLQLLDNPSSVSLTPFDITSVVIINE